jgi:predicted ATPase/class 3 adenylate cyclase/DNA-binding CsgD family transcriptional regulator
MATDSAPGMQLHLPAGTVTFLLTDIEGSTALWETEPTAMADAVARHYHLIDEAVAAWGGVRPVEQGEGDSAVAAFGRASDAVTAAVALQRALAAEMWPTTRPLRVRMAIHTGEARFRDAGNYMGEAIIRAARLRSIAHGGQILVSAPAHAVAVDRLGDQIAFRDLGVHRLKDLARPEHVLQVCAPDLHEDFPALPSLDTHRHNLPLQLSPFIGRREEITSVAILVSSHRLVTLCGSGGVGKTRLAQQVAAEVIEQFPDGVWWVELASLTAPDEVRSALAAAVGLVDRADLDVTEALTRFIGTHRVLVVLDNCEHVVDSVAAMVDQLLRACAGLSMIATSRASLDVPGELAWRVPPLRLPDDRQPAVLAALAQSDAVQLFADRAGRARPNFRLGDENGPTIAAICRRLDGVALAIELAAARVRSFTPEQILAGLDDALRTLTGGGRSVLPRQQTLEASVRWSHTLLSEPERTLLRRLSVFRGGFNLDAAEGIVADERLPIGEILDRLDHLIDQSLVVVDDNNPGRYRLLETVRQFAARQLEDSGEAEALRDSHAAFYADLVSALGPTVLSDKMIDAVSALTADLDNLRAALGWLSERGETDRLVAMVADADLFWVAGGLLRDGEAWLTFCIETDRAPEAIRGRLHVARSFVRHSYGAYHGSIDDSLRAIEIARETSDWRTATLAYYEQIFCVSWTNLPRSQSFHSDARRCAHESGDELLQVWIELLIAHQSIYTEGVVTARAALEQVRSKVLRLSVPMQVAEFWYADASCAYFESDFVRALECVQEGKRRADRLDLLRWSGMCTFIEHMIRWYLGEHQASLATLPKLIDGAERVAHNHVAFVLRWAHALHLATADIDEAGQELSRVVAMLEQGRITFLLPWTLSVSAMIAQSKGDYEGTARLIERGQTVQQQVGTVHAGAMLEQRAASFARCCGEIAEAELAIHRAINMQYPNQFRVEVVASLEILVGVLMTTRRMTDAARLAGAAQAARDRLGFRLRIPPEREIYAADVRMIEAELGDEAFAQAIAEGAAMSLDEAVAFAQRSRGRRGRPAFGWDSLTPAEQNVVELVIEGRTNVEIAQRLLMSRETVKTHLSHVFAKVHVRTRAQLAALAATRAARRG